jgi:hypothetical protein
MTSIFFENGSGFMRFKAANILPSTACQKQHWFTVYKKEYFV